MKKKNWLFVALIAAAILLYWGRMVFLGQIPVIRDTGYLYEDYLSFIPALKLSGEMLREGRLPLWSPYSQAGMVLFADPQYTFTYPLTFIFFLLPTQLHFALVIVTHLIIGAVGLYFLMRAFRASRLAAALSAFVYVFSFPVVFGILQINAWWPWHWLPLILLLIVRVVDTGERRYLYLLALAWGLQMFTYIQSSFIMSLLIAPFTLFYIAHRRGEGKGAARPFGTVVRLALAVALGTLMATALLLPLWEYKSLGSYRPFSFEEASFLSLSPGLAVEFLLSAKKHQYGWWAIVTYMGGVGTMFALYAVIRGAANRLILFFAAAAAAAFAMSLGSHTPLYRLYFSYIPGAHLFHHPTRFLQAIPVCVAVLAGLGFERLSSPRGGRGRRGDLPALGALSFLLVLISGAKVYGAEWAAHVPVPLAALRELALFSMAVFALAWAFTMGKLGRGALAACLLALVVADSYINTGYIGYCDFEEKYAVPNAVRFLRTDAGLDRFISYHKGLNCYPPHFMDDDAVPLVYPELSNYYRVNDIQCRGPLQIGRYADLIKGLNREYEFGLDLITYTPRARDFTSRLIDLFGVKFIVSKGTLEAPYKVLRESYGFDPVDRGKKATIRLDLPVRADAVILESFLEESSSVKQGEPVASMTLWNGGDREGEFEIRAGEHTAEGFLLNDYLRKDEVRHAKAPEADWWEESTDDGAVRKGTLYRGVVTLDGVREFDRLEVSYVHPSGRLRVQRFFYRPERDRETMDALATRFVAVYEDARHGVVIHENSDVLPRAFLVGAAEVMRDPSEALERVMDDDFDPVKSVIIEENPPNPLPHPAGKTAELGEVAITRYEPARVEMTARAAKDCLLFISDAYYPGWRAWVDGKEAHIYRANYAFRAVFLPPGEHTVVMSFRPRSLMAGAAISLLAFIAVAAGLIREPGRRNSNHPD